MNLPLLAIRSLLFGAHIVVREANLPSLSLARMPWPAGFRTGCRWLYPTADAIIASSSRMHNELLGMNVPEQKICLLPNPVDESGLRQRAQPIKRKKGEGLRFVAMGRLVPQKGFDRLLDAISSMPGDCNCMILGEGPEDMTLKQKSARLGLDSRVTFKGFVANPAPWIAGADAFLMPSRFEGMPNAALEALALGTPVIATPEAGGLAEIQKVTIAIAGNEFISEMQNTLINKTLAPSLLPEKFGLESVARNFNRLISNTLAPGR